MGGFRGSGGGDGRFRVEMGRFRGGDGWVLGIRGWRRVGLGVEIG